MDKLYNSLIVLNYGTKFCRKYGLNPIDSKYFLQNSNTGEHVYMFVSLACWIIKHIDQSYKISMPKDSDDLAPIILNILKFLPNDQFAKFSINRLKLGYGEQVILLLNILIDMWISNQNIDWNQLNLNKIGDLGKDLIIDQEAIHHNSMSSNSSEYEDKNETEIVENSGVTEHQANVDRNEDFDAVIPNLKTIVFSDVNGLHDIKVVKNLYENITNTFGNFEHSLISLLSKHSSSLDNLKDKEKKLNILVDTNFGEVKDAYQKYKTVLANYEIVDKALQNKHQTLDKLTLNVNDIRIEIKKRVDGMTDTSELEKSTLLLHQLQEEIFDMDIKIKFLTSLKEH